MGRAIVPPSSPPLLPTPVTYRHELHQTLLVPIGLTFLKNKHTLKLRKEKFSSIQIFSFF